MRVLMVVHAPPCPPDLGPARRHYHELREFLARGHRVSVLSYGTPDDAAAFTAEFGGRCEDVRFVPLHTSQAGKTWSRFAALARGHSDFWRLCTRRLQSALDLMAASRDFDVIWFSTTMLGGLRLPEGVPLVGDTHNVEFDNLRRACRQTPPGLLREYFRLQAALTRREEAAFTRRFDIVCTASERDRRVLQAAVPEARIEVIPNGVDLGDDDVRAGVGRPGRVVFTGLLSYYPNVHGIRWFITTVWPGVRARVPGAHLMVVGAEPPGAIRRLAGPDVTVTGYVDDVRPYLAEAAAYVIPLHIGGGTRVKALQAMAMRVPIVTTALGVEGLDLRAGEHALVADDPRVFAEKLCGLLENPARGRALASQAASHVRRFDWRGIGERLDGVLHAARRRATAHNARAVEGVARAAHSY